MRFRQCGVSAAARESDLSESKAIAPTIPSHTASNCELAVFNLSLPDETQNMAVAWASFVG